MLHRARNNGRSTDNVRPECRVVGTRTFCRKTLCRKTFCRKTFCRTDILPTDVLPNGRFAERTFCRTDILPKGQLAENRDAISSKCLGLCLISQLYNSQPLCKITIIWHALAVHNGSLAVHITILTIGSLFVQRMTHLLGTCFDVRS